MSKIICFHSFITYNYIFDYIHSNDLQGTRIWSCETMSEMIELEDFNFEHKKGLVMSVLILLYHGIICRN